MIAAAALLAETYQWDHMDGWGGSGMWLWGVAMMTLFVVLVVWLVRASVGSSGPGGTSLRDPPDRAREILAERYANGEVTTEEYRERVKELQ